MAMSKACPVCGGEMVESGIVDGLGLIYMCDDDTCASHGSDNDCQECGHPTAYVWVEDGAAEAESSEGDQASGHWERRCFDPLCKTA